VERNFLKLLTVVTAGAIAGTLLVTGTANATSPPSPPTPTKVTWGADGTLTVEGACHVESLITVEQKVTGITVSTGSAMTSCDETMGSFVATVSSSSGVAFVPVVPVDIATSDQGQTKVTKLTPELKV
jgi:hypothetical protein